MVVEVLYSRRRTIGFKVIEPGHLQVRAPLGISKKVLQSFIDKNFAWAEKKSAQLELHHSQYKKPVFAIGESFWYLGKQYITVAKTNIRHTQIQDGQIIISQSKVTQMKQELLVWYRKEANKYIPDMADRLAKAHNFTFTSLRISQARTRWGSCGPKNTLNFSWRLMQTPVEVIEYVIYHELAHTVHHNHSSRFWELVKTLDPSYKKAELWLKQHGPALLRW